MVTSLAIEQNLSEPAPAAALPVDGALGARQIPEMPALTVFQAAVRSAEFFDHLRAHYRETRRTGCEIPAAIKIRLEDGTLFDAGTAMVKNISPSGALLTNVSLSKACYPSGGFKLELVMRGGDYEGIGIEARPVRFESKSGGLGVKFEEIFVAV